MVDIMDVPYGLYRMDTCYEFLKVTYQFYYIYTNEIDFPAWYTTDIAITIGHELIHQWTGNLISCGWWDDLWINEAFADFGGYLSLRWAEPDVVWENQARTSRTSMILRMDD